MCTKQLLCCYKLDNLLYGLYVLRILSTYFTCFFWGGGYTNIQTAGCGFGVGSREVRGRAFKRRLLYFPRALVTLRWVSTFSTEQGKLSAVSGFILFWGCCSDFVAFFQGTGRRFFLFPVTSTS